jgi:hypothetical protein
VLVAKEREGTVGSGKDRAGRLERSGERRSVPEEGLGRLLVSRDLRGLGGRRMKRMRGRVRY